MANLGYVSTFNINGNELTLKDAALTEIVSEIIQAIGANNTNIAERINDLHNRSFDNTIKISSQNESEIVSIQDGLYKIQYVTVTGEGDNATETLNNSAILIQDGTNQYLYKDGQISSRTKTDSTWGSWITFEGGVTSVNGMTGAVTVDVGVTSFNGSTGAVTYTAPVTSVNGMTGAVTIPDAELSSNYATSTDTNDDLLLTAGDTYEEAFGKLEKAILDNSEVAATAIQEVASSSSTAIQEVASNMVTSVNGQTGDVTITIPEGQLSNDYAMSTATNDDLELTSGDTYETAFGKLEKAIIDNELVVTAAITDLDSRVTDTESLATVAKSGSYNDLTNRPTIPTKTSDLTNDSGFLTTAPVTSVNGQQGAVTLTLGQTNVIETVKVNNTALTPDANKAVNITVPTKTSDLTNDSGFLTQAPVTSVNGATGAVTVKANVQSDWNATTGDAVILNKPTIPAEVTESTVAGWGFTKNVGTLTTETQLSKGTATGTGNAVTDINVSNHQITLVKGATYATQEDINESISNLVNSAPATLDTLNELATALGNDPNFATTVATQIGEKYTKPSTGIPASDLAAGVIPTVPVQSVNGQTGAVSLALGDTNVIETIKVNNTALTPVSKAVNITVPTKVSDLTNDSNFTSNTGTITGITMNGVSKGTSGVVNLGTVLTEHQDISGKVDKVTGMGLSSNDYTTTEKNKLAGINIGSLDNLTTAELNSIFTTS